MKTIIFVLLSAAVLGCHHEVKNSPIAAVQQHANGVETVEYGEMLSRNRSNLAKLSIGMNKTEVMSAMGKFQAETHEGNVPNPYKSEMFTKGDDSYESLLYITSDSPPFVGLRDAEATPVIFKNGKLIGWGAKAAANIPQ